jgi:hypothetical protein
VGFGSREDKDDGEGDRTRDSGMVSGYCGLLNEVAPRLEVLAGFEHDAIAYMSLAALGLRGHASNGEGDGFRLRRRW